MELVVPPSCLTKILPCQRLLPWSPHVTFSLWLQILLHDSTLFSPSLHHALCCPMCLTVIIAASCVLMFPTSMWMKWYFLLLGQKVIHDIDITYNSISHHSKDFCLIKGPKDCSFLCALQPTPPITNLVWRWKSLGKYYLVSLLVFKVPIRTIFAFQNTEFSLYSSQSALSMIKNVMLSLLLLIISIMWTIFSWSPQPFAMLLFKFHLSH